jgi:pimeloyl-ACP methyl ester carboxylesterase
MDHTGYGFSPRPLMDDPCNMTADDRATLPAATRPSSCRPGGGQALTSLRSDVDELDTIVDYVRSLRNVERVHLIGWSAGGRRVAAYAATRPEKVHRLVLFAPGVRSDAEFPEPGAPMTLQSRETLMQDRWQSRVACEDQVDPGIRDVIWQTIMAFDSLGSVWGAPEGVMRVSTATRQPWNRETSASIAAPTLIMVGEQDELLAAGREMYADMAGTGSTVLVEMACATHLAVWEATQYRFMHEASREWLTSGSVMGRRQGVLSVERAATTG